MQNEVNQKNAQIKSLEEESLKLTSELQLQIDLNTKLEQQKHLHLEEIKLLKDYAYGIDERAKDVNSHKFQSEPYPSQLSKKFCSVVRKVENHKSISHRGNDPRTLVSNFKSEIELQEKELMQSRQIEEKLLELVHQIYQKLEEKSETFDPEIKLINKTLREIVS